MNKLLILNGSKCSGKSTVAKQLWKSRDKTILLSLDSISWFYSSYDRDKAYSLDLAGRVSLKMVEFYLNEGLDVIIEKAFNFYEYVEPFVKLSKKIGVSVVLINIEAPLEELIERSKTRTHSSMKEENMKSEESSIVTSYENYQKNKFKVDETYDSSKVSTDQIVKDIRKKYLFVR